MSAEETILFVAVIALGLALVVVVVAPKVRSGRRRKAEPKAETKAEPKAETEAGTKAETEPTAETKTGPASAVRALARENAQPSSSADEPLPPPVPARVGPPPAPPGSWSHLVCPTCRRQFAAGLRFCPYDARLLAPEGSGAEADAEREPSTDPNLFPAAKICPTCARRYELVAVVCARDGAPLVSVN